MGGSELGRVRSTHTSCSKPRPRRLARADSWRTGDACSDPESPWLPVPLPFISAIFQYEAMFATGGRAKKKYSGQLSTCKQTSMKFLFLGWEADEPGERSEMCKVYIWLRSEIGRQRGWGVSSLVFLSRFQSISILGKRETGEALALPGTLFLGTLIKLLLLGNLRERLKSAASL